MLVSIVQLSHLPPSRVNSNAPVVPVLITKEQASVLSVSDPRATCPSETALGLQTSVQDSQTSPAFCGRTLHGQEIDRFSSQHIRYYIDKLCSLMNQQPPRPIASPQRHPSAPRCNG